VAAGAFERGEHVQFRAGVAAAVLSVSDGTAVIEWVCVRTTCSPATRYRFSGV